MGKHELTVPLMATGCEQKKKSLSLSLVLMLLMCSMVSLFFCTDRRRQEKIVSLALSQLSVSQVSHLVNSSGISIMREKKVCFISGTNEGESYKSYERTYPYD